MLAGSAHQHPFSIKTGLYARGIICRDVQNLGPDEVTFPIKDWTIRSRCYFRDVRNLGPEEVMSIVEPASA